MWPVMDRNFCTSKSLAISMMARGFSWPSTTLVCSAEYTSLKLMPVGAAPKALNIEVHSGLTGTRILNPLRSSAVLMGLVELVMLRKPLSRMRSKLCRFTLAMASRMKAPRSPSIAFHTVS